MKTKETNEAFVERIVQEMDKWQDGNKRHRAAMVVFMDEDGKKQFHAFSDNRGKNPWLRFIGIMAGGLSGNEALLNSALMVVKFACKIRNRKQKGGAHVANK